MLSRMALLVVAAATGAVAATGHAVSCTTDEDCSLNGVCATGGCVCDPGWTTLPFGLKNAMSPGCGYLDFEASPVSECGPACAFHGGKGGVDRNTTSWGGSVQKADGNYWMFAAEMSRGCDLSHWQTNSQVVSAVADSPLGPFVRQDLVIPPWSHNPQAVVAPDGTWVIFTLGPGFGRRAQANCTRDRGQRAKVKDSEEAEEQRTAFAAHAAGSSLAPVNFTVHSAPGPQGPWTPHTFSPVGWNVSWSLQNPGNWNPAPVFLPDGSLRVMAHTDWAPWAGETILTAAHWKGPYTVRGSDLLDHCAFCEEDPFMWRDKRGHWHVLYHRMFDPYGALDPHWGKWKAQPASNPVPRGWSGGHAFSRDGFSWSNWSRCYNTSVTLTDGKVVEHNRRERPKLLFDSDGSPTHLYNGVFDAAGSSVTYTIVAPIKQQ
jgi:hypothetical protein